MKKIKLIILFMFIAFIGFSQTKYYPGVNRFTQNLTISSTGTFIYGTDTVTKIYEDTLINPAWVRDYVSGVDSLYWTISGDTLIAVKGRVQGDKIITDTLYIGTVGVIKVLGDTLIDDDYADSLKVVTINYVDTAESHANDYSDSLKSVIVDSTYWYPSSTGNKIITSRKVESDSADINVIVSNKINLDTLYMSSINVIKVLGDTLVDNQYVVSTIIDSINNIFTSGHDTIYVVKDEFVFDAAFGDSLYADHIGTNIATIDTLTMVGENVIFVYGDSLVDDDYVNDTLDGYYTKLEINDTLTDYYLSSKI
ncbi:MAG: hypothetical protein M0P71_14740, partial [Melioribacteraceae bacterium]|nr:hypothetical protein [Melioribacteraceae bacterium]